MERYTETIDTLMGSLHLDDTLCSHILDIIPKLVEARAQHWIKGEHGYFAGSYSDGNNSGAGGLTKSGGGGIMRAGSGDELEQAKKRDHKVFITDVAIDKVDKVTLSDFSEEQIFSMQEKHKELLHMAMTKNDSNEVLFIEDLGFKSEVTILGGEFVVSPGNNPFAVSVVSHAEPYSLVYLHNHPSTNNFSVGDIDTFVCEKAIKTISVVTNQGEVYVLNKLSIFSYDKTRNLLANIYHSFSDDEIDDKEFVARFLKRCAEGGIEYAKSK